MVDLAHQAQMTDALNVPRHNLSRTVVGMAHFAGTGNAGDQCGGCDHWRTAPSGKRMICDKYRQMTGDAAKPIPACTPSCRHFVARPNG